LALSKVGANTKIVFRLLRLLFAMGAIGAMIWFGATVPLGEQTLFEHIQAIWKTHESQDLVRGTKRKVGHMVDRATDKVAKSVARNASAHLNTSGEGIGEEAPPMEDLPSKDRNALRGLIGNGIGKQ
jgi:hypothetical protein